MKDVSGTMPHPNGFISVTYKISKKGTLTADISLPENTTGTFVWKNKEYMLKPGKQTLKIE